jgi:hypothetical protein
MLQPNLSLENAVYGLFMLVLRFREEKPRGRGRRKEKGVKWRSIKVIGFLSLDKYIHKNCMQLK